MKETTVQNKSSIVFLLRLLSGGVLYVAYLLLVTTTAADSPIILLWLLLPITAVCVGVYVVYHENDHIDSVDRGSLKVGRSSNGEQGTWLLARGHCTRSSSLFDNAS